MVRYRGPLFLHFLWLTRFLWRKWKKVHDGYPISFSILHMCKNFHHNRTNNQDFFILGVRSPIRGVIKGLLMGLLCDVRSMCILYYPSARLWGCCSGFNVIVAVVWWRFCEEIFMNFVITYLKVYRRGDWIITQKERERSIMKYVWWFVGDFYVGTQGGGEGHVLNLLHFNVNESSLL